MPMQHRGDESTGIVTSDGTQMHRHVGLGEVRSVFADQSSLRGKLALGHNRYSTTGATLLHNAQPFLVDFKEEPAAISHNGNFTNTLSLRERLVNDGAIFQTTSDTEVVLHLMARSSAPDLVPTSGALMASNRSVEEIRRDLQVDSLSFLSLQGMLEACSGTVRGFCDACFTGNYPVRPEQLVGQAARAHGAPALVERCGTGLSARQ